MIQYREIDGRKLARVTSVLPFGGWGTPEEQEFWMHRGTMIHLACKYLDEGILDWNTVDPRIAPYIRAWERAKEEARITILAIEQPVVCLKYGYCGRFDRLVKIGRHTGILEIKSGGKSVFVGQQTAAYAHPGGYKHRWVCYLKPDGSYRLEKLTRPTDFGEFVAFLTVGRIMEREGISYD